MMNNLSKVYHSSDLVHMQRGSWHLYFNPVTLVWLKTNNAGSLVIKTLETLKKASALQIAKDISRKTRLDFNNILNEVSQFLAVAAESGLIDIERHSRPIPCDKKASTFVKEPIRPESLYLHLTSGCNLRCTYCYNVVDRKRWGLGKKLPFEVASSVLRQAKEIGISNIFITGGEPLLHPKAIDIAELAHELQFRVIFMTNGLLVSDQTARRLSACCDQITISLDSYTPALHDINRGRGTHRRVIEAIRRLKTAGARRIVAAGVITRYTQHERYADFASYCKALGVDEVIRQLYILQGDKRDEILKINFKEFLPLLEKELEIEIASNNEKERVHEERIHAIWRDRCGAAYGVIAIGVDGKIYPCQALIGEEFAAGNVIEISLREIWDTSGILRKIRNISVSDIPGCCNCVFKHICGGGCRALAYNIYGSLTAPTPKEFCAFYKLSSEKELWVVASQPVSELKSEMLIDKSPCP